MIKSINSRNILQSLPESEVTRSMTSQEPNVDQKKYKCEEKTFHVKFCRNIQSSHMIYHII